ncbi:hypothetical protein [Streptomyces sp. NBC_01240]|uniref:hypothetical protein n=1 Tax=Streptomyces sp. NBC_01240 TaxID=2903793 RepID=UPI002E0E46E6|nr:hypothetical protein OG466_39665 [Streptomyces sp. NBC_01240]
MPPLKLRPLVPVTCNSRSRVPAWNTWPPQRSLTELHSARTKRDVDEHLMEQIESEQNLALLDPETRALVLICRDEGLRISEALTLKTERVGHGRASCS